VVSAGGTEITADRRVSAQKRWTIGRSGGSSGRVGHNMPIRLNPAERQFQGVWMITLRLKGHSLNSVSEEQAWVKNIPSFCTSTKLASTTAKRRALELQESSPANHMDCSQGIVYRPHTFSAKKRPRPARSSLHYCCSEMLEVEVTRSQLSTLSSNQDFAVDTMLMSSDELSEVTNSRNLWS